MATKKCPFCAEEIQTEAIKCRFCGESIENLQKQKIIGLNEKQETCLWVGVGIIDFVGIAVLYDRVVHFSGFLGRYYFKWTSLDLLLFLILIAITIAALLYSLQDRPKRPHWQELLIELCHRSFKSKNPKQREDDVSNNSTQTKKAKQPDTK